MLEFSGTYDTAVQLVDQLDDEGYSQEEMIGVFAQAVLLAADGDDTLLDAAANFLADGGVQGADREDSQ